MYFEYPAEANIWLLKSTKQYKTLENLIVLIRVNWGIYQNFKVLSSEADTKTSLENFKKSQMF